MAEPKRLFLRLDDRLTCEFTYEFLGEEKRGQGIILDIGGGGLCLITKDVLLKSGYITDISIAPPLGPVTVKGEVLNAAAESYFTDKQRDMFYTTRIRFKDTPLDIIKYIIAYVHKCYKERREAKYRKH